MMTLNPWVTIWTHPRLTVRQQLAVAPRQHVAQLAMAVGSGAVLLQLTQVKLPGSPWLYALLAVLAPLFSLLSLHVDAWLLRVTGSVLGGQGTAERLRCALAWSMVPKLVCWLLVPLLLLHVPGLDRAISVLLLAVMLWSLVLQAHAVGEAQGFSSWKGLANLLLTLLLEVCVMMTLLLLAERTGLVA